MDRDMDVLAKILRRPAYMHIEAVTDLVVIEHLHGGTETGRTRLSSDPDKRENQYGHLHGRAVRAFDAVNLRPAPAAVEGTWLVPYRRKNYVEVHVPELTRLNELMCRIQDGVLRARVRGLESAFSDEANRSVAEELLEAVNQFDYPAMAMIADRHPEVREVLREALAITDDELIAMMCLDGGEWRSLGDENGRFDRYYRKRTA